MQTSDLRTAGHAVTAFAVLNLIGKCLDTEYAHAGEPRSICESWACGSTTPPAPDKDSR